MNETEDQTRLRRAKEALEACRVAETEARKALASAEQSTRLAREKYNDLFIEAEIRERDHLRSNYNHATN